MPRTGACGRCDCIRPAARRDGIERMNNLKELLQGNEAVARGLYEAGIRVVSSYPGTPSTEITESAALFDEIYCEWVAE